MNSPDVRRDLESEAQRLLNNVVPVLNRQDDQGRSEIVQLKRCRTPNLQGDTVIVAPYKTHHHEEPRDQQHGHPGALHKLRHKDHDHGDSCRDGPETIYNDASRRARTSDASPMAHHSCLRKRERKEGANSKQGNQTVGHSAEQNQEQRGHTGENQDPLRIHQPSSPRCEGMRKTVVLSDGAAKTRKISKRGISREGQYQENRADRHVVEGTPAGNRSQEHGEHALIAGQAWVRSLNAVAADQVSNPSEKRNQESNDDG